MVLSRCADGSLFCRNQSVYGRFAAGGRLLHSFVGKYANDAGIVVGNVVVGVAVLGDRKERELLISPSGRIEERQFAVYAFPGFFVIRIYTYPALIDRRFLCSLFFASGERGQDGEFLHIESPV